MNSITLSPKSITALRVVRIVAWLAVAVCIGVHFAAPSPEGLELNSRHPVSQVNDASSCGCNTNKGTIS